MKSKQELAKMAKIYIDAYSLGYKEGISIDENRKITSSQELNDFEISKKDGYMAGWWDGLRDRRKG
jgi:hypothetical protein